ncbi:hypothetical protein AMECASPLE_023595 [Ameca splendens]|uniref:Uncharacterized protein n=1 Tax=Ameca splendens TaxID=208324 RepID=A0ABV0XT49_9TELE
MIARKRGCCRRCPGDVAAGAGLQAALSQRLEGQLKDFLRCFPDEVEGKKVEREKNHDEVGTWRDGAGGGEGVQIHIHEEEMCRLIKRILVYLIPARPIHCPSQGGGVWRRTSVG